MYHHLVGVLTEPLVAHHIVPIRAGVLAPAVLHPPAGGLAAFVQVHPLEDHGMGHQAVAVVQTLGLGHAKPRAEQRVRPQNVQIHNAALPDGAFTHIAAEPHGLAVLHLPDGGGFQILNGQVQVLYRAALHNVAQQLHGEGFVIGLTGSGGVNEAYIAGHVPADVFLKEAFAREALLPDKFLVLVPGLEGEGFGRVAQGDAQHVVDVREHSLLLLPKLVHRLPGGTALPQGAGELPELAGHVAGDLPGGRRAGGLGHGVLGYHAVFFNQIAQHIPLPAIVERRAQQMGNQPPVGGLIQGVENALQKVVGLFQLVIEEGVVLAELEGFQVQFFYNLHPHSV